MPPYGVELKGKRGRPKTNGVRPGWMFERECIALNAYDEARRAEQKHETALDAMVDAVHRWLPGAPMSRTEAKRIRANWQGKNRTTTIIGMGERILEGEEAAPYLKRSQDLAERHAELKGLPMPPRSTASSVRVISFGLGPVPRYPRINCRQGGESIKAEPEAPPAK